jgi:hypothetical protein
MCEVQLTGWRVGLRKVALTLLIRNRTELGLSPAKKRVDQLLDGERVSLSFADKATAMAFYHEATDLGAVCQVDKSDPEL